MQSSYAVLGLDPSADLETVKKAYRKLAKQYHPDRNPSDPSASDKFARITAAYDAITEGKPFEQDVKPSSTVVGHYQCTVSMTAVYLGTKANIDGQLFLIPPGFEDGDELVFDSASSSDFSVTMKILDQIGFTRKGSDLYTDMSVPRSRVENGKWFEVPNHPSLFGKEVTFPKDTVSGSTIAFKDGGLPVKDKNKDNGKLYITVTLLDKTFSERIGEFIGFCLGVLVVLIIFKGILNIAHLLNTHAL